MVNVINTVLITQARTGSTRLPNKVLKTINEQELLKIHLERISKAKLVDSIIVATTNNNDDDIIETLVKEWGYNCFRGSEHDVLDRFYQAVINLSPEWVVRVTSDCPLLDHNIIDGVISLAKVNDLDYCSNILTEAFPDGQDVEIFKFSALKKAWNNTKLKSDREHVTPYIRNNSDIKGGSLFKAMNFPCVEYFNDIRMTVDELNDYELIKKLVSSLGVSKSWMEYTRFIIEQGLGEINKNIIRNEGYIQSLKND